MKNQKRLTAVAFFAVFALLGGVIFGGTAVAKKKKKGGKPVTVTKSVNAPIPDAVGNGVSKTLNGKLAETLTVSKKFKGTVGNTAITFQTTGLAAGAAGDLDFKLTAPDGTHIELGGFAGQSVGPLTLMSNAAADVCSFDPATTVPPPPPCVDPDATVNPPYVGIAGDASLNLFNGVKGKGNWTFTVEDAGYAVPPATALTSILNTVTLKLTAQKPVV